LVEQNLQQSVYDLQSGAIPVSTSNESLSMLSYTSRKPRKTPSWPGSFLHCDGLIILHQNRESLSARSLVQRGQVESGSTPEDPFSRWPRGSPCVPLTSTIGPTPHRTSGRADPSSASCLRRSTRVHVARRSSSPESILVRRINGISDHSHVKQSPKVYNFGREGALFTHSRFLDAHCHCRSGLYARVPS